MVEKVEVVRVGKARRAKLYYLRDRIGKAAKTKEDTGARIENKEIVIKADDMPEEAPVEENAETVVEEVATSAAEADVAAAPEEAPAIETETPEVVETVDTVKEEPVETVKEEPVKEDK